MNTKLPRWRVLPPEDGFIQPELGHRLQARVKTSRGGWKYVTQMFGTKSVMTAIADQQNEIERKLDPMLFTHNRVSLTKGKE